MTMTKQFVPDRSEETRITHFMSISPGIPFDLMFMTGFLDQVLDRKVPTEDQDEYIMKAFGGRLQFGRLRNPADSLAYRRVMRQLEMVKNWNFRKAKLISQAEAAEKDVKRTETEKQHYRSMHLQLDGYFLDYLGGIYAEANRLWSLMLEEAGLYAMESIAKKQTMELTLKQIEEANND